MDVQRTRHRAALKIIRLSRQGLDAVSLWRAWTPVLAEAVPHYQTPCWYTVDPASRLITSHFQEHIVELPPGWAAEEYATDDVNHIADVTRSATGISTLHQATNGDPMRSPRWHATIALGGDQEMITALRTREGQLWGALGLYREPDRPLFHAEAMAFVQMISPALADGVRRALLVGEAADPETADAPGMVVLGEDWQPDSLSPGVERWLTDLPDGAWHAGRLPSSVLAVAGRAARGVRGPTDPAEVAVARVLTARAGTHPSGAPRILDGGNRRAAGDIGSHRAAAPEECVRQDRRTQRRELVTKIFLAHYEPRLRDNGRRVATEHPVRGGPKSTE